MYCVSHLVPKVHVPEQAPPKKRYIGTRRVELRVVPFLGAYISCPSQEHPQKRTEKTREISEWQKNDRGSQGGGGRGGGEEREKRQTHTHQA